MTNSLEGDAVVLAGATGNVGGATLGALVRGGARVVVLSRGEGRARATIEATLLPHERQSATVHVADLTNAAEAAAAIDACVERFGRIDALVSLAGSGFGSIPLV